MTNSQVIKLMNLLCNLPYFKGVSEVSIKKIITNFSEIKTYSKNTVVFDKKSSPCLCIILKGEAKVMKNDTVISHLYEKEVFGAAFLYNSKYKFLNEVIAITPLKVLIIDKLGIDELIKNDSAVAINFIEYLSERVGFLNNKIEAFTKPSAKEKLLLYLEHNCSNDENREVTVSMTELSTAVGISRASLYRVMDKLEKTGKIRHNGKKIYLTD